MTSKYNNCGVKYVCIPDLYLGHNIYWTPYLFCATTIDLLLQLAVCLFELAILLLDSF